MKKNKIQIILLIMVCVLFLILGCKHKNGGKISTYEDTISQKAHNEVEMTMVQSYYSSSTKKVDVNIKNNTSFNIYSGLDYSIEYYNGKTWIKLPLDISYFLSLVTILPKESKVFSIYLYPEQYNYQPGKYLIRKTVSTTKRVDDPKFKIYNLTAEFKIE